MQTAKGYLGIIVGMMVRIFFFWAKIVEHNGLVWDDLSVNLKSRQRY